MALWHGFGLEWRCSLCLLEAVAFSISIPGNVRFNSLLYDAADTHRGSRQALVVSNLMQSEMEF